MLALQVVSMKQFMSRLLTSDAFDIFLLQEAVISAANTVTIDGHLNREFFGEDVPEELSALSGNYSPWSSLKGLCFQLIRGKHTPLYFRFIFCLKPEFTAELFRREESGVDPSQISSLVLTVKYDGSRAILTTGAAYRTFLMSKEADRIWDRALSRYLALKGIETEQLS